MSDDGYGSMLASLLSSGNDAAPGSTFVPQLTPEWPVNDLVGFRAELLQWLRESWDPTITVREWWARLAEAGLTMPTWPRSYGGISAPTAVQELIESVFASTGMVGPPLTGIGLRQVGPAMRQHATLDQCERLLRPLMKGLQTWCVLLHEPDRDLGDAQTVAISDGARFTIDGDKAWSPYVDGAERAMVLAITDAAAPIRRRFTCFAVDLDQPGVHVVGQEPDAESPDPEASPLPVVTLTGVTAASNDAIGGVGDGWAVAQTISSHAQASLAGRIRRGVVDVVPGGAAGNLDLKVEDVIAAHRTRATRNYRRDEPGSDRRQTAELF
jgi:alkylation response protein AidB-like acyl-CoA dehydrogenase